jgi:hypothetical protein
MRRRWKRRSDKRGQNETEKRNPARKDNVKRTQIRIKREKITIKKKRGKKVRREMKLRKRYRYGLKVHFHEIVHHGT